MTDTVLIIDFGSQVTQLIARRVREAGVYCEIAPYQNGEAAFARAEAEGGHPVGRPGLGDATRARRARRRRSSTRACRSSPSATASRRRPCSSAAWSRAGTRRNSAAPISRSSSRRALFDGVWEVGQALSGLDEPRRPRDEAARGLHREGRRARTRRSPSPPTRSAASTPPCSTPKWCTRPTAPSCFANFVHKIAGLHSRLDDGGLPRGEAIAEIREQVGKGACHLRPVRRRRFSRSPPC